MNVTRDKLWFKDESFYKIKTRVKRNEEINDTIKYFMNHDNQVDKIQVNLNDGQVQKMNRDAMKYKISNIQSEIKNETQEDVKKGNGIHSKRMSQTYDPQQKIHTSSKARLTASTQVLQAHNNETIMQLPSANRLEEITHNISNEVADQRLLPPYHPYFYYVNKNSMEQNNSFQLNVIKPTKRTSFKAFFSQIKTHQGVDEVGQIERFKNKFFSPQAQSSQISITKAGKTVVDLTSDKTSLRVSKPSESTWRKQAKHLKPIYERRDVSIESQIDDYLRSSVTNKFQEIDIMNKNYNDHQQFDKNCRSTKIGCYKTVESGRAKSLKHHRRMKQFLSPRTASAHTRELEALQMTEKFKQGLNEMVNQTTNQIPKVKNPQSIDDKLLDKIQNIKHYQAFGSPAKLSIGDKLVIFGLMEREDSDDMLEVKKFIRLKQAQQLQSKIKNNLFKIMADKNNHPPATTPGVRANTDQSPKIPSQPLTSLFQKNPFTIGGKVELFSGEKTPPEQQ